MRHAKVFGKHRVAGHVGENGQCRGHHHRGHDRQPVEAVSEVDRIAGADDDEISEDDKSHCTQRNANMFEERYDQLGLRGQMRGVGDKQRRSQPDQRLPEILGLGRQALGIAMHNFPVVVHPAHRAKPEGSEQHHPDIMVGQIRPQQGGNGNGHQDQRAAHGRCARLDQMALRTVVAYCLADFHRSQLADHGRSDHERDGERSQRGQHCPQRDVVEHVERTHILRQILSKPEQH